MHDYTMTGTVRLVKPVESVRDGFTKREIVICDNDPRFPSEAAITFVGERCALLDCIGVGEPVSVDFWIAGREWNGRHFVELRGIAIHK